MNIYIGSLNQVKIDAVQEVFALYEQLQNANIKGIDVSSKVPAQPKTQEETMWGARNRAYGAFVNNAYLSIGLESGIFEAPGWEREKTYMDHTICVIYDGEHDYIGFSPAFRLPRKMVSLIFEEGMDLDQAALQIGLTTEERVGRGQGVIGVLTQGIMDRKAYMKPALIMALAAWQNKEIY